MVSGAGENSDGFSSGSNWNATDWNNDPNTIALDGGGAGNSVLYGSSLDPSFTGGPAPTSTAPTRSASFPSRRRPSLGASHGLATYLGSPLSTMFHSQRTQTTYNFNFGWEYNFPHGVVLSAGYVGSRGLFLPLSGEDLNQLDLGTIGKYQDALLNTTVPNQWEATLPSTNANYGSATVPLWVSLQEYPQFGNGGYGGGRRHHSWIPRRRLRVQLPANQA